MAEFARSLAVVIGINHYGQGITPLHTAVNDAREVARILEQDHQYDKVWLLLDQQASLQALQQLLNQSLAEQTQSNDRLFFYFAGHGIALNGDEGPEGYLIPQDAKLGDTTSYLPMPQLQKSLSELPCRHFLGILDCCFAGAFRWSSTRDLFTVPEVIHKERYDRFIADPAWQTITSAAYDQKALDSLTLNTDRGQSGNHSPFAAALIEALSGRADAYPPAEPGKPAGDGVITATELYLYLRDRIEPATEGVNRRQTPGIWPLKKHDKGEYIFLTPGHVLNLPPAPPLDESQNPYRGLQSFEEDQSDLFFGRQALTRKLYEFVEHQPLTVVLGASGSGKSSLVKAGLIPQVRQVAKSNSQQWQILSPIRLGEAPFRALYNVLEQEHLPGFSAPSLGAPAETETLAQFVAAWKNQGGNNLLLVIDQFEELITLCRDDREREQFLQMLAQAVASFPKQLHLVLTLRADFEPQFQDTVLQEYWSAARFVVPPMSRAELREAIEEPASKRVIYFQSDDPKNPLVDQLIDEVAETPGALPLLSFTLSELYLKYLRRQKIAQDRGDSLDRAITEADYKDLGGVARSLTQRADQEYEALVQTDPAYGQTIRHVMLRMVAVGGGELARRRVPLSEFEYPPAQNDRVKQVIQHFSAARLLVEGTDADGKPYAEPAHDALVRGWQKLLTWKQEEAENLILQRRLTPAAEEWQDIAHRQPPKGGLAKAEPVIDWLDQRFYTIENRLSQAATRVIRQWQRSQQQERSRDRPKQFLWDANPYLDVLNKQLQSHTNWFNQNESEFVQASVLQRRKNTSWRWRIAIGVILGLSGLTIAALIGQRNAQIGQAQASRQAAEASLQTNQELDALINALRAGRSLETLVPWGLFKPPNDLALVHGTLSDAIQTRELSRLNLANLVRKEDFRLKEIFYSSDGRLIAVFAGGSELGAPFRFWDLETQQEIPALSDSSAVQFTEYEIDEFNSEEQKSISEALGSVGEIDPILISPDQKLLIHVARGNGQGPSRYTILDRELHHKIIPPFAGYLLLARGAGGASIALSHDGSKLATIDGEGIVHIWEVGGRNQTQVEATKYPKSNLLAASNESTFADSQDSETQRKLEEIKQKILDDLMQDRGYQQDDAQHWIDQARVIFSQDKQSVFILGRYKGRVFYLWDLESYNELKKIRDELENDGRYGIESASFSPDGKLLAIADTGNLRIWDLKSNQLLENTFQGDASCNRNVQAIVFSPNGQLIATGSIDDAGSYVCVRNLAGYQLAKFEAENWHGLSFSSDSRLVFTTEYDSNHIAQAWRIESFNELMVRGCNLVQGYLNAPNSDASESDRRLCDGVRDLIPN